MDQNNPVTVAKAYYAAMGNKDVPGMMACLHPNLQFSTPLTKLVGKGAFLEAATKLTSFFKTLTVRSKIGCGNEVSVIYDLDFPAPIGKCPTAALLTFQEGLISKIELFFDPRPFEKK